MREKAVEVENLLRLLEYEEDGEESVSEPAVVVQVRVGDILFWGKFVSMTVQ